MVTGIVGYARWPTPPETYRFCVAGEPAHLHDAQGSLGQIGDRSLLVRVVTSDESVLAASCDILYLGAMSSGQRKKMLAEAVERPILTISENDAVCADATMFCLAIHGSDVGLLANLDAISRSGIRISPKVLQLLRRRQN